MDNFTKLPFSSLNLDLFYIRTTVFAALKESLPKFKGKLLDVGCGKMPYKNFILENSEVNKYIGLDIENAFEYDLRIRPDYTWDGKDMPFDKNNFDCAFATEVLEHCPQPETVLKEVYRVLKPDGIFFFTVPFIWPLHEVPHDEYRYTPFSLKRIFEQSGFADIQIYSTGGWHASLAQMLGLWVRRSEMSNRKRKVMSLILKPIIKFLIAKDIKPVIFCESQMITGLYGIAKKA